MTRQNREVGAVAACLVCDSFFLVVVGTVPPLSHFSGRKGTREYEELLYRLQLQHFTRVDSSKNISLYDANSDSVWEALQYAAFIPTPPAHSSDRSEPAVSIQHCVARSKKSKNTAKKSFSSPSSGKSGQMAADSPEMDRRVHLLPCPTCRRCLLLSLPPHSSSAIDDGTATFAASATGWSQREDTDSDTERDTNTVFSPCVFFSFEEQQLPPLYADSHYSANGGGGKPKWTLVSGVGPPVLELDSSRSGRLYKPSLRPLLGADRCVPFERWVTEEEGEEGPRRVGAGDRRRAKGGGGGGKKTAASSGASTGAAGVAPGTSTLALFAKRHQFLTEFWEQAGQCDLCGERRRRCSGRRSKESEDVKERGKGGGRSECLLHFDHWNQEPQQEESRAVMWLTSEEYASCLGAHVAHQPAAATANFAKINNCFDIIVGGQNTC